MKINQEEIEQIKIDKLIHDEFDYYCLNEDGTYEYNDHIYDDFESFKDHVFHFDFETKDVYYLDSNNNWKHYCYID